jgi:uncharacterized protein YifN (PemK superfamily)
MFKNYVFKFLKNKNLSFGKIFQRTHIRNFSYDRMKTEELMNNNIKLLDGKLYDFKNYFEKQKTYNHDRLFEIIQIFEFTADSFIKKDCEKYIMQLLNDQSFIDSLNATNLSRLFYFLIFVPNLTQTEIDKLSNHYFKLKNENKINKTNYIEILDTLYYIEIKDFNIEEMRSSLIESTLYYFDTYNSEEIFGLLATILFMNSKDISKLADSVVIYMNSKILDINNDIGLSIDGRLVFLQYYPRILKEHSDDTVKSEQRVKMANFFKTNANENCNQDILLCNTSNYCHYARFDPQMVEKLVLVIRKNIGGLRTEFIIELFFLIIHFNINQFEDKLEIASMVELIINAVKDSNTITNDLSEIRKDYIYFKGMRDKILPLYSNWYKNKIVTKDEEATKLAIFSQMVDKSMQNFPFAMREISENMFDELFDNFKLVYKL